jgi:hypothetical protein
MIITTPGILQGLSLRQYKRQSLLQSLIHGSMDRIVDQPADRLAGVLRDTMQFVHHVAVDLGGGPSISTRFGHGEIPCKRRFPAANASGRCGKANIDVAT